MKKHVLSFFAIAVIVLVNSQNLSDGLLLHYDFNGNANDISGNGMHATVYGATLTTDRNGNPNSAYYFDGVDDYIEMPNDPSLKPQLPLTIAFWVRFDDMTTWTGGQDFTRVINTDHKEDTYTGVWIYAHGGKIRVSYGDGQPNITSHTNRRTKIGNTVLQENIWYHVVCIVRGATDMDIYINCENDGGIYEGTGGILSYSENLGVIGKIDNYVGLAPAKMKGVVDDIRYWDRALTLEEVDLLCEPTLTIKENKKEELLKGIYPNPSNGDVTLLLNSGKELNIELYDITGKVVLQLTNYRENELKINNLNQGLYFVKVQDEAIQTTQKIIVTKD